MEEIGAIAKAITEYGVLLVLVLLLFKYVYDNQKRLDEKSDLREAQSYQRELEHRAFIEVLQNDIKVTACENNVIVRQITSDVDGLHGKMVSLGAAVDNVNTCVKEVKENVFDVNVNVTGLKSDVDGVKRIVNQIQSVMAIGVVNTSTDN